LTAYATRQYMGLIMFLKPDCKPHDLIKEDINENENY